MDQLPPWPYTGVIIGGIIGALSALLPTVLLLGFEYRKWHADRKLQHLRARRDELERRFTQIRASYTDTMNSDTFHTDHFDLFMRCPKMVRNDFDAFMKARNEANGKMNFEDLQGHWMNISASMTAVLIGLDEEIDDLVK